MRVDESEVGEVEMGVEDKGFQERDGCVRCTHHHNSSVNSHLQ